MRVPDSAEEKKESPPEKKIPFRVGSLSQKCSSFLPPGCRFKGSRVAAAGLGEKTKFQEKGSHKGLTGRRVLLEQGKKDLELGLGGKSIRLDALTLRLGRGHEQLGANALSLSPNAGRDLF